MDEKIAVISGSSILTQKIYNEMKQRNLNIMIKEVDTLSVVSEAEEILLSGIKILISRGNTAAVLRKHFDVPVVDIKHTFFDCYHAYKRALTISDKIAFLATSKEYERMIEQSKAFLGEMEIFHINLLDGAAEADRQLEEMMRKGIEVAIGGLSLKEAVENLGIEYVMSEADTGSISDAVDEALHLLKMENEKEDRRLELENRYQTIKSIYNCVSDGIMSVGTDGKITNMNNRAIDIFKGDMIGKDIRKITKSDTFFDAISNNRSIFGEMIQYKNIDLVINAEPIQVDSVNQGAVLTLQKIEKIQEVEQKIRHNVLKKGHMTNMSFDDIIGVSDQIIKTKDLAMKFSQVDNNLLINGETGTGKELFAQSIHNYSKRKNAPFVAINCAAFPSSVLESELFGYVKGAFTGASDEGKLGMFELAHQGTIFLDEISETPLDVQLKLLRVIQEKKIIRIGDDKVIPIDVRIITASNKNLMKLIEEKLFREDFYYRICVLELNIPPLKHRRADIPHLIRYFIDNSKVPIEGITNKAVDILSKAEWPGNVRHLSNIIERLSVISDNKIITSSMLGQFTDIPIAPDKFDSHHKEPDNSENVSRDFVDFDEESLIMRALRKTKGNRKKTAKILGISTTTLWRKMKECKKIDSEFLNLVRLDNTWEK
ncbi:MAG: hypothetical protein AVO33_09715 [delta proteobacterium ML8_F1]|nr:MAG: hypothetical protein AVO33_09715 [delta proteobacterium ML8_F1]